MLLRSLFSVLPFVLFVQQVVAHSWLDCLSHDPNVAGAVGLQNDWVFSAARTKGVCEGYARNYAVRDERLTNEINTKPLFYRDLPNKATPVCVGQSRDSYGGWRRMLSAKPGDTIYMGYTEDGHLSKTFEGVGTTIAIFFKRNRDEIKTVADLQDVAAEVPFDDGKMCGEPRDRQGNLNGRTGRPCVQSFKVPTNLCPGIHSFMWYWNSKGTQTAFYSCFDVNVV
jgi:hypothetical protein